MCETPKSPPGDYNGAGEDGRQAAGSCVKHLNPRQGITILSSRRPSFWPRDFDCVKHLNPRQGITIQPYLVQLVDLLGRCETPKSPPGDYNWYSRECDNVSITVVV